MHVTLIRPSQEVAKSLLKLLPKDLPPALRPKNSGNLYEVLSRTPNVEGLEVHQTRWSDKRVSNSYWKITDARFKCEGKHGKAWGILYWRGKKMSPQPELIRGGLKYVWKEGRSSAVLAAPQPKPTAA
ncbi:hypothetical protein P691DRAFT_722475 [Macrolepiota fuliginosa MF-IS2]|uniref:Uncharacterized protein n=1 Tax=Macrolepiota fuliginosa MF-IS2 TaxID=1400762 RepID=A0A9P6C8E4_9AGAR|nr:hypothetical protein P691DRAFT_722475 [Macrolepiota fuliginosa MF-IS2]